MKTLILDRNSTTVPFHATVDQLILALDAVLPIRGARLLPLVSQVVEKIESFRDMTGGPW